MVSHSRTPSAPAKLPWRSQHMNKPSGGSGRPAQAPLGKKLPQQRMAPFRAFRSPLAAAFGLQSYIWGAVPPMQPCYGLAAAPMQPAPAAPFWQQSQFLAQQPMQFKRRSARNRRRRSAAAAHRRWGPRRAPAAAAAMQQPAQSPVCPPAPYNDNKYLMDFHAVPYQPPTLPGSSLAAVAAPAAAACPLQQPAIDQGKQLPLQQAAAAGVAGAANSTAAAEEVAEWDPLLQETTTFQRSAAGASPASSAPASASMCAVQEEDDNDDAFWGAPASPVCPPAPLLTNEYYMARFELQRQQEGVAVIAPAVPLLQAEVVEWDPLLKEVTTLQHSTAHWQPETCMPADDARSQC